MACHVGVLLWTIELGVHSTTSNSLSHAVLLKHRNHVPVTSVTWHPQGDLLVSCSPADTNMIIWDTSKEEGIPLKRVSGGGLCFARWSSCGSQLFVATCRNVFRYNVSRLPVHILLFYMPSVNLYIILYTPEYGILASQRNGTQITGQYLQVVWQLRVSVQI